MMWLGRIIPTIPSGIPEGLEHYTTLPIQALDLGIIVPSSIVSGVLLLKKNRLGYLLAPILVIKGITMLLAIDAMIVSMLMSGVSVAVIEIIIFPLLTLILIFNLYKIFLSINSPKTYQ
ncbi:MAG: hypothetical protein ACK5LC_09245 [Coprobacillaceae bacterium]